MYCPCCKASVNLSKSASQTPQKGNAAVTYVAYRCAHGVQEVAKGGFPFPSMFNALAAQGLPLQSAVSEQELPPLPLPQPAAVTDTSGHKYDSPLRVFRSYRQEISPPCVLPFSNHVVPYSSPIQYCICVLHPPFHFSDRFPCYLG